MGNLIQNEILGLKWLNRLVGRALSAMGLDLSGRVGGSIQFFLYDVIKITILLCVLIFLISYIQSFFPPERSRRIMGRFHGVWANLIGALLGTVTPFCSCSSMLLIAVCGGTLIEHMHMEDQVEDFIRNASSAVDITAPDLTIRDRMIYARDQVVSTFRKVFPYILLGVGIGAVIHNWIPQHVVETVLGNRNPLGVILATLVGVPMYADIFGTIPVAEALLSKGALLGTVLSFMMAVTTLSLPSLIMLRKAIRPKLLTAFIVICIAGIIVVGYGFNLFQGALTGI